MKVYYGKTSWDGCIATFNVCFRKKNYDYLLEFETSSHYLTIYLFSDYSKPQKLIKFIDKFFGKIERIKSAKNQKYLNRKSK